MGIKDILMYMSQHNRNEVFIMGKGICKFVKKVLFAPVVTGIGYLFAIMPRMTGRPTFELIEKKRLYAHRGLYDNKTDAPENSMKAFKKAVDAGFGIELDVQLTKDERVVVFHDFSLKRMCNVDKKVNELTYAELSKLTLLDTDCRIPLFEDVLELVNGKVPLIIEYKLPSFKTDVCEIVDEMLQYYNGSYCVESFHPMAVLWYRIKRPEVVRGILSSDYVATGDVEDNSPLVMSMSKNLLFNFIIRPDFVAYDSRFFTNPSRQICKKWFKAPSVAWTIKSQKELELRKDDYDVFIFEGFIPE